MANINIHIDDELKQQVETILSDIGLSISEAITVFLKQIVRCNGMPFELKESSDEATDDAFCEKMYQNYLNNPDPHKHDSISFDDALKECGLTHADLQN